MSSSTSNPFRSMDIIKASCSQDRQSQQRRNRHTQHIKGRFLVLNEKYTANNMLSLHRYKGPKQLIILQHSFVSQVDRSLVLCCNQTLVCLVSKFSVIGSMQKWISEEQHELNFDIYISYCAQGSRCALTHKMHLRSTFADGMSLVFLRS